MTENIDLWAIKNELVTNLRNWDILTTTQRGVTTTTDTGTWTAATSHLINRNNVRNIRSITVDTSPLSFGNDYTIDYTYDDSGTIKCKIDLVSAQTGTYSINYDYGTDKIFTDFPQESLSVSNFPRIAVDILDIDTKVGGLGNINENEIYFTIVVYDLNHRNIEDYHTAIRKKFIENQTSFYYLNVIRPKSTGPLIKGPGKGNKVFQRNKDYVSMFNYEINN